MGLENALGNLALDATLAALSEKVPELGQAPAAASMPVTLANEVVEDFYQVGQAAQTEVINNILDAVAGATPTDAKKYRSFTIQVVSTGTAGTYIFEGSNDGVNYQPIPVYNQALVVRVPIITAITATASQIIYEGSCNFRYIRLRIVTAITGGSIQAFSVFIQEPLGTSSQVVTNGTSANLLATITGSVYIGPSSSYGFSFYHKLASAATTNATSVKAAAGSVGSLEVVNVSASPRYFKIFNKASAPVTGTDTPVLTYVIPPNSQRTIPIPNMNLRLTNGISYAITGAYADFDNTPIGANEVFVNIIYV
jgi:hypothetical protein